MVKHKEGKKYKHCPTKDEDIPKYYIIFFTIHRTQFSFDFVIVKNKIT